MAHSDNDFGPNLPGVFDFTILFEQSILQLLPACIFLLLALLRTWTLIHGDTIVGSRKLFWAKQATVAVYFCLRVTLVALWTLPSTPKTKTSMADAVMGALEAAAISALSWLEHSKSVRPSILLNLHLLLSTVLGIAAARTYLMRPGLEAISGVFAASLAIKAALLALEESPKEFLFKGKTTANETAAGIINRGLFWWLNPLLLVGAKRRLSVDDIGTIENKFDSARLLDELEKVWANDPQAGRWALMKCTFLAYKWQFFAGIIPRLLFIGFTFAQPLLINSIVNFVGEPHEKHQTNDKASSLIGATALVYIGIAVCNATYHHMTYQLLTMYRGGLASLVFKKTLRLDASSIKDSAPVTLMSTDIESIVMSGGAIHDIWASFIEIPVAIYLLYRNVGIPSLLILIPAFLTSAAGALVSPAMGPAQVQWNQAIQERVGSVSTMLSQIKGVKMMGLTDCFHDSLQRLRVHELKLSVKFRWIMVQLNSFATASEDLTPVIVIVAAIFWTKADQGLTIAQAFTSLSIINIAATPLVNILISIVQLFGAIGCFSRLQAFLVMDERKDLREMAASAAFPTPSSICRSSIAQSPVDDAFRDVTLASNVELATLKKGSCLSLNSSTPAVAIESATLRVGENIEALTDISMIFPAGTISMIVGRVGCGKSSLLKAIAGELSMSKGRIVTTVSCMAYCDQTPWLQNCSIRDNVVAQSPLDEGWLYAVMEACALDEDISMLPLQDFTVVGSGGVALSGGQRQRVALARALYSRHKLLLLDDVFSGLDSTTSRIIFQRVFSRDGLVRKLNATVIMATNHVKFLPAADHITMLGNKTTVRNQVRFDSVNPSEWGIFESDTDSINTISESGSDRVELEKADIKVSQEAAANPARKTEADLTRQTGDLDCYRIYVRSLGKIAMVMLLIGSVLHTAMVKMPQVWLKLWTQKGTGPTDYAYMGGYIGFALASTTLGAVNMGYYALVGVPKSAIHLHEMLLRSVIRAPFHLFASTDSGMILNRFSQDMMLIDNALPMAFLNVTMLSLRALAETGLVASGASYIGVTIPICFLALYLIQKYYLGTSRQMRVLDLEMKSPLYTQFTETLAGLSTIRSFGWANALLQDNHGRLDTSQKPFYTMFCIQRWLQVVLDLFVAGMALVLVSVALNMPNHTTKGALGLAMVNLIGFNQTLALAIDQWTRLETSLGAIARLKWFMENTPDENKECETAVPEDEWPTNGHIELDNVVASYSDEAEPVLKGVSLSIKPGQKVGVCGRSGSGKSSLMLTLARLLETQSGSVRIDAQDLALLPRHLVRSRLTTLPQDAIQLRGTVRHNLDPRGAMQADGPLEEALRKTAMWDTIAHRGGLDADMDELRLSAGQTQLFCLARALLARGAVVLLDEATSSIDTRTDDEVRRALRHDMKARTVVEVAHRLEVVRDYDLVVVMAEGRLVEVGEPETLLATKGSAFKALWESRASLTQTMRQVGS